jgi:hypothetical protein
MVWKILNESVCVVHDVKLRGQGAEVKHQIDVSITVNGTKRSVLVECKDFELAGKAYPCSDLSASTWVQ